MSRNSSKYWVRDEDIKCTWGYIRNIKGVNRNKIISSLVILCALFLQQVDFWFYRKEDTKSNNIILSNDNTICTSIELVRKHVESIYGKYIIDIHNILYSTYIWTIKIIDLDSWIGFFWIGLEELKANHPNSYCITQEGNYLLRKFHWKAGMNLKEFQTTRNYYQKNDTLKMKVFIDHKTESFDVKFFKITSGNELPMIEYTDIPFDSKIDKYRLTSVIHDYAVIQIIKFEKFT